MSNVLLSTRTGQDEELITYFLHPGKLFAARRPYRVTTILGSCVSVCLYDPEARVGGINHFILPASDTTIPFDYLRFGNHAVPALIRAVRRHGAQPRALIAKLFGGAALFSPNAGRTIGKDNVSAAVAVLQQHGIPVIAEDVGGNVGRKLVFDTGAGTALVKRL